MERLKSGTRLISLKSGKKEDVPRLNIDSLTTL